VDAEPPCPQPVLQFDGVNDHADVPDDTELDLPNTFTVEAWIRPTVTTAPMGEMHIVSHHDSNALKGWALLLKDGRLELRTYGDGTSPQIAGNDSAVHVVANRWSFVAGTYDGNTLRVYADGTLRDTEATSYARYPYRGPLVIGRAAYDLTRFFFAGQIDEVRLSRVARYTGNTAPIPTAKLAVDSNTIALWHFDDAIGTNGTFVNAVGPKHAGQLATAPARPQAACGDR